MVEERGDVSMGPTADRYYHLREESAGCLSSP